MTSQSNLSHMISGWNSKYSKILKEFNYNRKDDFESAVLLNSILKNPLPMTNIDKMIKGKTVFCIGSGHSLSKSFKILKKYSKIPKIVADSSIKPLLENGIVPDIIVTDLDGDEKLLRKLGKGDTIFVVHAHGDNISKLHLVENFKNCIGSTQSKPVGKIKNFGGFTDGDRTVFLASHFGVRNIILFGMDFGKRISRFSQTKKSERKIKIKKLKKGKELLEWLAQKSRSNLYTTSSEIRGYERITLSKIDIIIT